MIMTYQSELSDKRTDFTSGTPVPADGVYRRLNMFGSPAGESLPLMQGQKLPDLPLGWAWRLVGISMSCG
jgi:hypothetical protein